MTFQPAHKDTEHPAGQIRYPRTLNEVIKKIEQEEGLEPHRIVQGVSKVPGATWTLKKPADGLVDALLGLCESVESCVDHTDEQAVVLTTDIRKILQKYVK